MTSRLALEQPRDSIVEQGWQVFSTNLGYIITKRSLIFHQLLVSDELYFIIRAQSRFVVMNKLRQFFLIPNKFLEVQDILTSINHSLDKTRKRM